MNVGQKQPTIFHPRMPTRLMRASTPQQHHPQKGFFNKKLSDGTTDAAHAEPLLVADG
jgi:hypothetical protein